MRRELFVLVSASAIALGVASAASGCSSSSTTTNPTGTDSGVNTHPASDDSGATGNTDSGNTDVDSGGDQDSGVAGDSGLHGCATYVDNTGKAEVDLTWGFGITSQADHCSKIKAGSVVKWTGDFAIHPLEANGGDTPTPIGGNTPDAGSIYVTFPNAGLFGYDCQNHPNQMFGAIFVVP